LAKDITTLTPTAYQPDSLSGIYES